MDPQIRSLYTQIKARQISPEDAAAQLQLWKSRQQQAVALSTGAAPERQAASPVVAANDLLETVQAVLIQAASRVLKVDAREIDGEVKLHEYGFDQVTMTEFFRHISEVYGMALTPELLREYPTLHGVASYLVAEFADVLQAWFRTEANQEAALHNTSVSSFVPPGTVSEQFRDRAVDYFTHLLSAVLKIPLQSMDAHGAMDQYGINSVLVMELTEQLEKIFGSLPKTLFFEYHSISELTAYFLECHGDRLKELLNIEARAATPTVADAVATPATEQRQPQNTIVASERRPGQRFTAIPSASSRLPEIFDVAIIGLAGRYPGAENLAQFWENLKAGRNCITEIPAERWDWRAYFDAEKGKFGSLYTRWGGFLSAIDTFDPLFFHISPAEAQHMDPQERLFIEETYAAIEDAGYTPATLGERGTMAGRSDRRIGVFVGVMNGTYSTNSRYWSIANRVSYLFDLQGPSMAVDTACSSSLSAIHLALESLYRGTCTCAIAGGVNIIVDPIHYLGLSAMTMLSSTNQCKAFGDQADGFVDGEGVGVLILKPLRRAVEDNDHIYGVIKGSMINAGGKTNGYTVPNPRAQARVIAEALQQMGVNPRTVSYVEAHGTGTALGDPLEIAGLTQAFRQSQAAEISRSHDTQFCRIGSVKSNIGHLEGAAGIAGVTKVLLQLQHRQLVPSLHAQVLNPGIDFANTPFVVQQELTTWQRPRLEVDGDLREYPRIAGISSFGAGGANAHLIIEEYIEERTVDEPPAQLPARPALIVLSAKNAERLQERAQRLLAVLRDGGRLWSERNLIDAAYTLQVGREAMEERLALMARSPAELQEKLAAFLAARPEVADLYRGRAGGPGPESLHQELHIFAADEDLQRALGAWVAKGKYDRLLSLWVKGLAVDWEQLYGSGAAPDRAAIDHPRRLSLPTYPFAKERYWAHSVSVSGNATASVATRATLHPLLHHNTSDLSEQRFSSTLSGREFFLADHLVRGHKVLPAVAYLEMAREALQRAASCLQEGPTEMRLQNVVWARPLVVGETPVEVQISLVPEVPAQATDRSVRVTYEIYSQDVAAARVVHSQGLGLMAAATVVPPLELAALQAQCDRGGLDAKQCYEAFAAMGLDYGAGHRGMRRLYLGSGQVLAKLALPEPLRHTDDRFVLHPSLMDAALQASFGLLGQSVATAPTAEISGLAVPFALRELSIAGSCTAAMWAWVRYAGSAAEGARTAPGGVHDLDIDVCDDSGAVRVRLRGFSLRVLEPLGERVDDSQPGAAEVAAPLLAAPQQKPGMPAGPGTVTLAKTAVYLTQLVASVTGLPAHRIEMDAPFEQYGMDSIMAMQLTTQLEKVFGPLAKTLFFEYHDMRSLSGYFLASHLEQLQALLGLEPDAVADAEAAAITTSPAAPAIAASTLKRPRFAALPPAAAAKMPDGADIAVIGLAGRYPKANNLDEFWENLRTGRDCITEIPAERWQHEDYFDPDKNAPGKAYSKWGGFLDDVDRFDPLFFNISPRQAEIMDPQERLFLECVWHLLENAGHTREGLRARYQSRVGVYVGAMYQPYHAFDADLIRESAIAVSSYYAIANRVSHFFDFQGPSMAIDTACSSALVAIHMACKSLRQGECRLAIAGGVNLSLHPKKYLGLSLAQMIGSHADSRSFGDGDGYIPAEGVGAVLLKPLAQAIADGDTILALIKSSTINHSGHTYGYTVPNPTAQAQLMIDNFRKSGINPRTISYVESAANGSALGDPIEINALQKAFREFTRDQGFCTIGSVKSNIGHAEAASGISQLTKVILQLQHGLLVPSIKVEPLNPNLSFDGSPFALQRQLSEWKRPVIDGVGECPRRATISSFGAGGSNAHLIVEEYAGATPEQGSPEPRLGALGPTAAVTPASTDTGCPVMTEAPQVVVFSARNGERLLAVAEQLLAFVQQHPAYSLAHLAYTLQTRREAMTTRLAMVVSSRDELVRGLEEFLRVAAASTPVIPGILATSIPMCSGDLEGAGAEMRHLLAGQAGEAIVQVFLAENSLEKLALYWTQGGTIPWQALHAGQTVRAVPLPNYPFARQRYWIAEPIRTEQAATMPVVSPAAVDETAAMTPASFSALSPHDQITYFLTAVLSEELGIPREAIPLHKNFQDYGADSIAVLKMTRGFEEIFQARISGREMLEYPTVASLSGYLAARLEPRTEEKPFHKKGDSVQVQIVAPHTAAAFQDGTLLHHLFTAQAEKTPQRTAVVFQDASVTYGEIDARSTVLARYLQQQGAGPETCIGLYLERSLEMLLGVLGILKAGAAYVPLDASAAEARIDHMIHDSGMRILLTHASVLPRLQALQARRPSLQCIALDSAWEDMAQDSLQTLQNSVNGHNLAYMIYTSGSTGEPKGVMISHLAAARHCEVIRERWGIDPDKRVLQFTPLSFDPSVEQIFATLSAGAVVVLADPGSLAPKPFSDMLMAHQINILNIPPAFALELLREWQHDQELIPATLQTLITGGDVLAVETVQLWQAMLQDRVTLLNAYGPTETTVTACLYNAGPLLDSVAKIPIGRPFGNRQVYIVDHHGHPTPHGVAGEIQIGGMGLARGYRHRAALTAATFAPDPFATEPGARLYKAGDLGQFLPDGNIAFLGRSDHQVKIRGYRIELGEIEAVLARHPAVAQAAAMAMETSDDKRLVGYVVAKPAHTLEPQDLQRYVRQKLPEYMIPSRFVMLEHMPLTSSGKIDRLRLPVPSQPDGQAGMFPRDERERQLASLWEELLEVRQPGIEDDFFTMGGHSILAIRLLARIRDTFGTELPLAALLQAPTIQGLAEMLRGDQQVRDFTHLVALQKGTKRPFFCVPGVGGTVFYLLKLASLLGRDQPFYGLQARGLDGETLPYSSVEDMAKHYVQAIRTVQPQGPYWLGGHSFGGHVAFEIGRQLQAMGQEIGALVLIDCPAPAALILQRTWDVSALFLAFAKILGIGLQENPSLLCQMLGDLHTDAKLAILYEEVMQLDAFPLHVDMGQFRGLFQVYLLSSMMQYVPEGRLNNTRITLLAAQEPHSETLLAPDALAGITNDTKLLQQWTEISASWAEYDRELRRLWAADVSLGWGRFATGPIAVRRVSGNHMDMLNEPHVQVLATVLKEVLAEQALATVPCPPALAGDPYPLSKVQEGLWLLQKFSPHMSAYNVPIAIRFTQGFDADIFRQTCALLLDRYPILGSRFTEVDGVPQQYIPAVPQLLFQHEVLEQMNEPDLIACLSAKVQQPFDLERGPLMRVHLFSRHHGLAPDHIALITMHHIVFDGTSSILLATTLMSTYNALSRGEAPAPEMPEASYQDFVLWEQQMLAGPEGQEHLAWWQQHLAGELPVLALRPDHPRPAVRGFHGATLAASLDPTVSTQLKALARAQRVSLSTLLLSIYTILLQRYSGQEDIIVGMPTMGRPKQVFDRVMGCFINMMAVRSRVSGEQSFIDYLKTLQLTMMDSLDHAVYPFSELVRELQVDRDQSASPIFQTYYAYQNYVTPASIDTQPAASQDTLHTEFLDGIHQEGDKDLGLEVYEEPERFILNIKYNPDLYEVATMQRFLEHFTRLAAAVVQQPYGIIAAYDSFSAEQKTVMLRDWNNTTQAFPTAQLLFQLLTEQAAKTPDSTAVVYQDQSLTYAELDSRSSKLAAYLQQRGVEPETFVGLYMQRSLEIVVGAVGILKAGGVYVPLDPALPMERLAYMIEDAGVAFLLTTATLASPARALRSRTPPPEVMCLDTDWPDMGRSEVLWHPPALQPENLAYVIYTSGSTGRPKGVMIPHSTTTRHCASICEYFRITAGARVCLQSPISFDASIEQIFAPLSMGATVAIRDLEVLSPKPFSAMLADLQINIIQLPPAFIQALFREWQLHPGLIPPDLKLLISCGDVLAVETVRLWQSILKERFTLLNVYGPTEVTAKAAFHQIDPVLDTTTLPRIPIGRPLANKKIYILDRYTCPTPPGVPGELHIGGTGPGRGYHGRPALTAEKFIPDPFSDAPDARLYKTGDLAYYGDDGTIEFLGRIDHQVKVRGHRIELGEIEALLAGHPGVKNAAVTTVERRQDKQLVAYLVAQEGYDLDQEGVKTCLARQLPDYMVPAAFVLLPQMPLTPSGKINRRGLPLPEGMQRHGTVAPRDAVELELARIWAEVLDVQNPDVRQDFFALGGHSLLAIRLMVLIEERLGRDLPLSMLFQAPTIEQLAAILRQRDTSPVPTLVPLQPLGPKPPFFCVPGAGGTVLYLSDLASHLGQEQPFYAFQARGLEGQSAPYPSVRQMAADYIRAMHTIQPEGPYFLGGHSFGGRVAFEMTRQLERRGQPVHQLVLFDCRAPQPAEPAYDWDEAALLVAFAGALGLDIADHVELLSGIVAAQPLDHKLEHLRRALREHHRLLPDTRSTHFKGLFQVFSASSQLQYVPDGPVSAGITLFKAGDFQPQVIDNEHFRQRLDDPAILSKIEAMNRLWAQFNADLCTTRQDPHLGWERYTTGAMTVYEMPGDHMNMVKAPHAQSLARALRGCLAR